MKKIFVTTVVLVIVLASGYFIYKQFLGSRPPNTFRPPFPTPTTQESKTFYSDLFDFTVTLPSSFQVKEGTTSVEFTNSEGAINIYRTDTDFTTLSDFWEDFRRRNKPIVSDEKRSKINGMDTVTAIVDERKLYVIYEQNIIYTVSTKPEPLYDDLDQIAQSFQYTP